jgi:DNA-binding winged helix-turn-helix (wHTH) protein/tetratricopeptide (TPR) repeat protein
MLRAHRMIQPPTYQFDEYRLDPSARELSRNGAPVAVPTRVFDCLVYLIENRERAIGRDELVAALWGRVDVSDAQLGQIVLRARRAVGDDGNDQRCIRTMPKYGYRWMAQTRIGAAEPAATVGSPSDDASMPDAVAIPPDDAGEAIAAASRAAPAATTRRWVIGLAIALVAGGVVFAAWHMRAPSTPTTKIDAAGGGIAVLPVEVTAGPDQDWVRLGGMDALASRLRAAGLRVPPSESVLAVLQARGQTDGDAALRNATSSALVVHARLQSTPQGWRAELVAQSAKGASLAGSADGREILPTLRRAADQLLMRMGKVVPDQGATENGLDETLQRADAAMLANQLDVARTILLAAPALVRTEPQLRYRLAMVDFRAGRLREVESTLQGIVDDSASSKDALLRARALTGLGTVHLNLGRFADAERDFTAAVVALEGWQRPLERGEALGGRGASRAAQYRYADAAEDLGRARIELEQAGDALGSGRLDMVEGELELQRNRPQAARPRLEHAVAVFERFDAVNERTHSLAMLVESERLQLDYTAALATSDRALELRARVKDPQLATQLVVSRAALLLDLGRYAEAGALLAGLDRTKAPLDPQSLADIDRVRAELALATGDASTAVAAADASLHRTDDPHAASSRAWAAYVRAQGRVKLGQRDEASRELATALGAESAEGRDEIAYHLAVAKVATLAGRDTDAEQAYAAALAKADAEGIPLHLVTVAAAYGEWLIAHDRASAAEPVVGRVAAWADRDFRCALLQVELFHALGQTSSWSAALVRAERLAGEREIPVAVRVPPSD